MKGVVFTQLLDHIESLHGPMFLEALLAKLSLPSGGAYTSVGTYDSRELVAVIEALATQTGSTPAAVLREFGQRLFGALAERFRELVIQFPSARALLEGVDGLIHPIVHRLYPDAELPRFVTHGDGPRLQLEYRSARPFASLALGLIEGCLWHYDCGGTVDCTASPGGATFMIVFAAEVVCPQM